MKLLHLSSHTACCMGAAWQHMTDCDHSIVPQSASARVAGYETTSTAISYALYELARNPKVQQKLQAEVDALGQERQPSYDDLSSFPYAKAVFSEGMRLHPPVTPFIALVLLHLQPANLHLQ